MDSTFDAQEARRAVAPKSISYPADLPITMWRDELLEAIGENQVVIVAGETGSGKSTQLPKLCLELGRGIEGRIGHTQPRRIAARSIAERVAEELGSEVGSLVGYKMRFTDEVGAATLIKVMTDGILLAEIQRDRMLRQYDTIIIDEAHERSLNVDFLLGFLKRLLPRRPDLKVIVTSATIDTERFSEHFDDAPIIEVAGRTYPVEIMYRPLIDALTGDQHDQTGAICHAVSELATHGTGDVLVFCSGEREIMDAVDALRGLDLRHTEVLPLFGRLSAGEQHRVFSSHTGRRIVVATNVAETSLTVPGIRYVVDTGMARISRYSKRTKVQQLPIEAISRASAEQRSGRCGRLGPGVAIRLYAEDDFNGRPAFTDPEILRTNLASVMLQLAAAGLGEIEQFPFIDGPDTRSIRDGVALLEELGAVKRPAVGTRNWLTDTGRKLARIPTDPRLGRMLLAAHHNACLDEVLTIVSALAIQDPRERPSGREQAADERHSRFKDESSDFASWLLLWNHVSSEKKKRTSGQFSRMCNADFLSWRRLREWQDIRAQLARVMGDMRMRPNRKPAEPGLVHESLLAGLLTHVGKKDPDGWEYRGAQGARFAIRPGSTLFKRAPEWVMAAELVETTRTWATGVAAVDPETIEGVAAHLVRRSVSDPWWDAARGAAVGRETVTLFGLALSTDKIVLYDHVDEVVARDMFIRHALVAGEWDTYHAFAIHNDDQIEAVLEIETRERRGDLLVTDKTLATFFDERLPAGITSASRFDAWWKTAKESEPMRFHLTDHDLIDPTADAADEQAFPRTWHYGDIEMPLTYEFDPASEVDGVTVDIPLGSLDHIDPRVFAWNVPGLRTELATALVRSLPKQLRKLFAPVPDTVAEISSGLGQAEGPPLEWLARELTQRSGTIVTPADFDMDRVPHYVTPRFRILDPAGSVVAEGRDLALLRIDLQDAARASVGDAGHPIERVGVVSWDFGTLPQTITLTGEVQSVVAYPALVDDSDSVSIRLMATGEEQAEAMWAGVRRLVMLSLPTPRRLMRDVLRTRGPVPIVGSPYTSTDDWMADCLNCAVDSVMAFHGAQVWSEPAFDGLMTTMRSDLAETLSKVGVDAATILDSLHDLKLAIGGIREDVYGDVLDDVDQQIDRIVFPGFVTAVGVDRLDDLRRYIEGAAYRLTKLTDNPAKDRERMARVVALEDEFDQISEMLSWSQDLVDTAWMLQELRVSIFAQPVGVSGRVSEKRVAGALQDLLMN